VELQTIIQNLPQLSFGPTKGKGKGSSLVIAPFAILDIGALQFQKWQLIGTGCSTAAQASSLQLPVLTDYWAHSMQPTGILRPNQPR